METSKYLSHYFMVREKMMQFYNRWLFWLAGLSLASLLVAILLPGTRWVVRTQLGLQIGLNRAQLNGAGTDEAFRRIARQNPDNYLYQLAIATDLDGFKSLVARFPRPSAYAAVLRWYSRGSVHVSRKEEELFPGRPVPSQAAFPSNQPSSPQDLAEFDHYASLGEQSDPDNSFFPAMRAAGLFAAHKDVEAVDALIRAGSKPRWDDYVLDPTEGQWQISQEAFGQRSAISHVAIAAATLLPHYAALRATARMAIYEARLAELNGNREQGLAIRHATMLWAGRMREQSSLAIGPLVAIAISAIMGSEAGGTHELKYSPSATTQEKTQQRRAAYFEYLRKIGHPEEAQWAQAEITAGEQARDIIQQDLKQPSVLGLPDELPAQSIAFWAIDLLVLANIIWLLAIAAAAVGMIRCRPRYWGAPPFVFAAVLSAGAAVMYAAYWSQPLTLLLDYSDFSSSNESQHAMETLIRTGCAWLAVLVPVIVLLAAAAVSVYRHVPVPIGMTIIIRTAAPAIACILLLAYSGLVFATSISDARFNARYEQRMQHEGAYAAHRLGLTWPGLTPPQR